MKNKTKQIQTILFLGAMWGICEATIGHLLHFLPYGFSGMLMFPIGFYFMYNAYQNTNKQSAIFMTGIIAASIKFIDFLVPLHSPMSVINPATSIILESLVVFAFIKIFSNHKSYTKSFVLGLSWILLFLFSQNFIFQPANGLYLYPIGLLIVFVIMNTVVSGFLVGTYLLKQDFAAWKPNFSKSTYALPLITIIIAVILEIGNSVIF